MNLFIQIPCHNEEGTLPSVISDIPVSIPGIDAIYTLVIDDGSTDRTQEVAQELGVDYVLVNPRQMGLAKSFARGIDACITLGADLIVNTDGDHQYKGEGIEKMVHTILNDRADLVIGCRDIKNHTEFSFLKKKLQKMGSFVASAFSNTYIPDTTSGFRALTRETALRLQIMNSFTYTLETLIQAGRTGMRIASVPIDVNPATRSSRLFKSNWHFILNQIKVLLIIYLFYCPLRFFGALAAATFSIALLSGFRISYYLWFVEQSLQKYKSGTGAVMTIFLILTIIFIICGLFGSLFSGLRQMIEDIRYRMRHMNIEDGTNLKQYEIIESPQLFTWQNKLRHKSNL